MRIRLIKQLGLCFSWSMLLKNQRLSHLGNSRAFQCPLYLFFSESLSLKPFYDLAIFHPVSLSYLLLFSFVKKTHIITMYYYAVQSHNCDCRSSKSDYTCLSFLFSYFFLILLILGWPRNAWKSIQLGWLGSIPLLTASTLQPLQDLTKLVSNAGNLEVVLTFHPLFLSILILCHRYC